MNISNPVQAVRPNAAHAQIRQACENLLRASHVRHQGALRHLEPQGGRRHVVGREQLGDGVGQMPIVYIGHRDVDRHGELQAGAAPGPALPQRCLQHPVGEGADQTRLLGQGNKLAGRDKAALRVLPAHERLDAADPAGRELHLGLIVQQQVPL